MWIEKSHVPIHKKGNKQTLENYRPVSLLAICDKVFESLIYNSLFDFFIEIYKFFDAGYEVKGFFLDISKAYDFGTIDSFIN